MNWIKTIKESNFYFKKKLGQNFLIDNNIIDKIYKSLDPGIDGVFEIGPGIGCLTNVFLNSEKIKKVVVVELDTEAIKILEQNFSKFIKSKKLIVINADILKVNINDLISQNFSLNNKVSIVSNLPYNISSPVLFKLFKVENINVQDFILMFQTELAQRINSPINLKQYNNLTVVTKFYFDIEKICDLKKTSFFPVPKVNSTVLKFHKNKKYNLKNEEQFLSFIKQMFLWKRKTVSNNLKKYLKNNINLLEKVSTNDIKNKRPENLSLSDFYEIYMEILKYEN